MRENIEQRGVDLLDRFTGKGTSISTWTFLRRAFQKCGLRPRMHALGACDSDKQCQRILLGMDADARPTHVVDGMDNLMPDWAIEAMNKLDPFQGDRQPTSHEVAVGQAAMKGYMSQHSHLIFDKSTKRKCRRHGGECFMYESGNGLLFMVITPSCKSWSVRGKRMGFNDQSYRSWLIFIHEVLHIQPDVIMFEETPHCPLLDALRCSELDKLYNFDLRILDVLDFGLPQYRERLTGYGFHKYKIRYEGSWTEFDAIFFRSVALTGEVFFALDDANRNDVMSKRIQKRGVYNADGLEPTIRDLLPPFQVDAYDEYVSIKSERQGLTGAFIFDVEQKPKFSSCGPLLCTLVTHGTYIDYANQKIMTPAEHLGAMGDLFSFVCANRNVLPRVLRNKYIVNDWFSCRLTSCNHSEVRIEDDGSY